MDDIRLTILEANNIKTEGQLREVLGAWNDYTPLKNDLANARKEIEKLTQVENKYEELKKRYTRALRMILRKTWLRLRKRTGSTESSLSDWLRKWEARRTSRMWKQRLVRLLKTLRS